MGAADGVGSVGAGGSTRLTDTRGRPRSPSLFSRPCSAAWSTIGPSMTVVPSPRAVRLIPSKRVAHRELRCPLMQIVYRLERCGWPADVVLTVLPFFPAWAAAPDGDPWSCGPGVATVGREWGGGHTHS